MELVNDKFKEYHEKYISLISAWDDAHDDFTTKSNIFNRNKLLMAYQLAEKNFEDFTHNVYAKAVYDEYSQLKPLLIEVATGKKYGWDEIFKNNFEEFDNLDRSILVGLAEGTGGYKLFIK